MSLVQACAQLVHPDGTLCVVYLHSLASPSLGLCTVFVLAVDGSACLCLQAHACAPGSSQQFLSSWLPLSLCPNASPLCLHPTPHSTRTRFTCAFGHSCAWKDGALMHPLCLCFFRGANMLLQVSLFRRVETEVYLAPEPDVSAAAPPPPPLYPAILLLNI